MDSLSNNPTSIRLLSWTCSIKRLLTETDAVLSKNDVFRDGAIAKVYNWPFRHVLIDNAFEDGMIAELWSYFNSLLNQKSSSFHYRDLYDLYFRKVPFGDHPTSDRLYKLEYKNILESLFQTKYTKHTVVAMHNTVPRTNDKYVHTDWGRAFFYPDRETGIDRLINSNPPNLPTNFLEDGVKAPDNTIVEQRALTAILYLNKNWKIGDGGATGLFTKIDDVHIPVAEIEPYFNRLFIFENGPFSFHNTTKSSLPDRNIIIQWFHTSPN